PFADGPGVRIVVHATPAGRLPVVTTRARSDFELLIRALTRRNEPQQIPRSMGACIVGGYNNWSRIADLRAGWAARQRLIGAPDDQAAWEREFQRIVPQRDLYQDRFVILSTGPYSGTPAEALGLEAAEWLQLSHVIRLEHECAHYVTRRVLGSMRNSLLDELIADYTGIVAARGRFVPEWLLHFMGVEGEAFRSDGRLANYRGTPALGDEAFAVLRHLVRAAARTLDAFDEMIRGGHAPREEPRSPDDVAAAILTLAAAGLEHLTTPDAAEALHAAYMTRVEPRYATA
nr:hypothetical protein [Gemmatimonadaceae bacterium]